MSSPLPDDAVQATLHALREESLGRVVELERSFNDIVQASEAVAIDDEHDPEGHTIAFERQQIAGLLAQARVQADKVDQAIARSETGEYGICEQCEGAIAPERLAALPETRFCVSCAD